MKKQILLIVVAVVPSLSFAKVTDFNSLISENTQAQKELHSVVKSNVKDAREVAELGGKREKVIVVESVSAAYNAPTKKDLLVFEKEKSYHRASDNQQVDRLATELSSIGD